MIGCFANCDKQTLQFGLMIVRYLQCYLFTFANRPSTVNTVRIQLQLQTDENLNQNKEK